MVKSDKFDEWMLNCQKFSHQNFALEKFQYCIAMSGFVTLCWDMVHYVVTLYGTLYGMHYMVHYFVTLCCYTRSGPSGSSKGYTNRH